VLFAPRKEPLFDTKSKCGPNSRQKLPATRINTGEQALFRLPENSAKSPLTQVQNRGFWGIGEIGLLAAPLPPSARAKGKRLGRPTVLVDTARIAALRASGRTWTSIAQELGVGEGTVRRAAAAKNLLQIASASALVPVLEPGHFDPPQTFVSGETTSFPARGQ